MKLVELAARLEVEFSGDPETTVERVSEFERSEPGAVTMAVGARRGRLDSARASVFIVESSGATEEERHTYNLLLARNPKAIFAKAIHLLHVGCQAAGGIAPDFIAGEGIELGDEVTIHPRVTVGRNCRIGRRAVLHPGVVLGNDVAIGDDTVLFPNVTLYEGVTVGQRCILHAGVVVGADGFGFAQENGHHVKIPQIGTVVIEDDVEIGANSTVDRATLDVTRIGRGTKIDNLVHIAHNCRIGEDVVIAAQAGLSGGVTVGRRVAIAGQVGVNPQVEIGEHAVITGQAGVTKSVAPNDVYAGTPITRLRDWKRERIVAAQMPARLPQIEARLAALERALALLSEEEP
jgi:UDP-3-O-[3-hydroxymyristoyl] glucosamine N-acyltransferase